MVPDRWSRAASLVVGAFTVVATLVQVLTLPAWLRAVVAGVTVAAAVAAAALFFQAKQYENAVRWALRPEVQSATRAADFSLRPAVTEAAYTEVCRTSAKIYGANNVPLDRTLKWWRQFPEAVFAAYWDTPSKGPELAAYLSVWPIKPTTYAKLRAGRLRERELSHRSIEGIRSLAPRRYWYVSNIVVAKRHRKSPALRLLLRHALHHWFDRGALAPMVSVVALAYSPDGAALLRRFGFIMLTESSPDNWPIFEMESTTSDLEARLGRLL